jgi:hypothetical protein
MLFEVLQEQAGGFHRPDGVGRGGSDADLE